MLGLTPLSHPPLPLPIRSTPRPFSASPHNNLSFPSFFSKTQSQIPRKPTRFLVLFAENNDGLSQDSKDREDKIEEEEEKEAGSNGGGGDDGLGNDRKPIFSIRWGDLLDPDPDNLLAIALTGVLAWASVQVLWQLFFISLAILLAALKYSFIAALLIFILITLL
ncbi:uncharacterized protein LOC132167592 [Corylus avellana]|uniref:uncharacterized protein LOC132167592 n=1 Tax=Corylus avellana TaxID=13451 RepID=UPI001E215B38|nr:uncharacterized protein LOC132167592 [Corylus avellana]